MSNIRGQTTDLIIVDEAQTFGDKDFEISGWCYISSEDELEDGGVFFRRVEAKIPPKQNYIGAWDRVLSDTEKSVLWNSGKGISMNELRPGR